MTEDSKIALLVGVRRPRSVRRGGVGIGEGEREGGIRAGQQHKQELTSTALWINTEHLRLYDVFEGLPRE